MSVLRYAFTLIVCFSVLTFGAENTNVVPKSSYENEVWSIDTGLSSIVCELSMVLIKHGENGDLELRKYIISRIAGALARQGDVVDDYKKFNIIPPKSKIEEIQLAIPLYKAIYNGLLKYENDFRALDPEFYPFGKINSALKQYSEFGHPYQNLQ